MLFKDENVSQLLSGLNFQIFLCAGSREGCTTGCTEWFIKFQ